MKKILCPVDFSNASRNGLEYAGNLAAQQMAHITLLYVRPSVWPEAVQMKQEIELRSKEIVESLSALSDQVEKEFGVTCGVQLEQTTQTVESAIARLGMHYDLIVSGTDGVDDFYKLVFGTHSLHMVQEAMVPVLLVPSDCSFKPIRQIVYAYDPETNPIFLVDQLKAFAIPLGASVKVLHVMEAEPSEANDKRLSQVRMHVLARSNQLMPLTFEGIFGRDVPWTLEHYAHENAVDLLALSYHHRTLMDALFHQSVIKRMSLTANFPLFTFWR